MDIPLEESNLALIGSDADKAAREAAAKIDLNWEGAGSKVGVEVWRIENKRDDEGNPDFGINEWPIERYGEFYRGDSYIVLLTTEDEEEGDEAENELKWDIFFWIGSNSSQDEYGVAAYKTAELDDLLGTAPIQHREVESLESEEFLACFPKGITYLDGGISSGFRDVSDDDPTMLVSSSLFHIRKKGRSTVSFQVPLSADSLNEGDAFVLSSQGVVYTWFGSECSPFEKNKAAEVADNFASMAYGHVEVVADVQDDNEDFWSLLGGTRADIKPAEAFTDDDVPTTNKKMYIISIVDTVLHIQQTEPKKSNLVSSDICALDDGKSLVILWVGKDAEPQESKVALYATQEVLKSWGREKTTSIARIVQGQESRCRQFATFFD